MLDELGAAVHRPDDDRLLGAAVAVGDQLYDNAAVTGWHTGYPDTLAVLDPSTLRMIPWEPKVAALLCDYCLEVQPGQEVPGTAVFHRLTRAEYNNTIRDLLGDNSAPARSFAADQESAKSGFFSGGAVANADANHLLEATETLAANGHPEEAEAQFREVLAQEPKNPFILLNLAFSTQAAYAAPLILLAQNRQADRDRVQAEEDRARAASTRADTEYLAREVANIRILVASLPTAEEITGALERVTEALESAAIRSIIQATAARYRSDMRANQAARGFRQEGLHGSDRVALLLRNGREMIEVALGTQKLGLVACPVNTWATVNGKASVTFCGSTIEIGVPSCMLSITFISGCR